MSKAFTRESDESEDQTVAPVRSTLPPGTTNYITPEGAENLRQCLKALLQKKENFRAPPDGTESDLKKLEANIRALQQTLGSVVVAQPVPNPDKVAFGSTVRIRRQNGEEENFRIVGVDEADPENNSISWISPLARALLSRKVGDTVRFRTPAGVEELTLLSIG